MKKIKHNKNGTTFGPMLVLCFCLIATNLIAQQSPEPKVYSVGNPLGFPANPTSGAQFQAISSNVKVYGGIYSAESCSYDEESGLIVVPNRGLPQSMQANDA